VSSRARRFTSLVRPVASLAVVVVCIGAVVGFGAAVHRTDQEIRDDAPSLVVSVDRVALQTGYSVQRSFVGRVEARQQSMMGFEIGGLVTSVAVEEGDAVAAGTVIATLDTARLEARLLELEAAREIADANRTLAELTLGRTRESASQKAASLQELDNARQALAAALAAERQAEAVVNSIRVDIAKSVIRAPFDAVIAERLVDAGRVVSAGEPIAMLFQRSSPQVRLGVGGNFATEFIEGTSVELLISDRSVSGHVLRVLPTRDSISRDVAVLVRLDVSLGLSLDPSLDPSLNPSLSKLRQGDLARYAMEVPVVADGFWVPIGALAESERGLWSLYRIVGESDPSDAGDGLVVTRVEVEVLHAETDRAFVRGPLTTGDRFVVDGLHRITPGMRVRLGNEVPSASSTEMSR